MVTLSAEERICVAQAGCREGMPVVLFHGWPGSRLQRPPDLGVLRDWGVRLVTMDRPGIGGSPVQTGRRLLDWPPMVEKVADRLGLEKFHLVGVSAGGPYALACAREIPHRLLSLSLLGSLTPLRIMEERAPRFQKARLFYTLVRDHPCVARWLMGRMRQYLAGARRPLPGVVLRRLPPSDREVLADPAFAGMLLRDFRRAFRGGIEGPFEDARVLADDWGFEARDVTMKVRLWHGLEDTVVPVALGKYLAGELPDCEAKWVPGLGHYGLVVTCLEEVIGSMRETR